MTGNFHHPTQSLDDLMPRFGDPASYEKRAAQFLIRSWLAFGEEFPELIRLTLATSPALAGGSFVEGFFERGTDLGDGRRLSKADLIALLRISKNLAVMSVMAMVDEPFGNLVAHELASASSAKCARIERLRAMLDISVTEVGMIPYELLHRTAAAVIEARRFCADTAVMMVHSFDRDDCGIEAFQRFARAIGIKEAQATYTSGPVIIDGVKLYVGWTADQPSNECFSIVDRRKTDAGFFDDLEID